jgi:hypothetical protein
MTTDAERLDFMEEYGSNYFGFWCTECGIRQSGPQRPDQTVREAIDSAIGAKERHMDWHSTGGPCYGG